VEWENEGLNQADVIVFWIPRDLKKLPGFTTNVEFGLWVKSGKVILGCPDNCPNPERNRYLKELAIKYNVPIANTLKETLKLALDKIGNGQLREGGESKVPLYVYQHPTFKKWLEAQKAVGNEIRDAKVLWTFFPGKSKNLFCFVVHLYVWIKDEDRVKINEFSFFRSDISSMVLFYQDKEIKSIQDLMDVKVLLVTEYRVPARNFGDCKVTELPGGSSKKDKPAEVVAVEELEEETSFSISPSRLIKIDERQLAGTLSAHTSSVFAANINKEEYNYLSEVAKSGKSFGVIEDTEMTYVKVMSIKEILQAKITDWSTIGMIFESILKISSSWANKVE
jgi:8-oxo-dGTP pyrophosphatase MutT (NUDIX family)